jgi:hypothetical protein
VDKEMCALGESYIKGGIEFYSKLLKRNIALRKLMGKKVNEELSVRLSVAFDFQRQSLPLEVRNIMNLPETKVNEN